MKTEVCYFRAVHIVRKHYKYEAMIEELDNATGTIYENHAESELIKFRNKYEPYFIEICN